MWLPPRAREYREMQRWLPPRAAWFRMRAQRLAVERDDQWALYSATQPEPLGQLVRLARGARNVVELGTAIGWTTGVLALADRGRAVTSFDPFDHDGRSEYLALLPDSARMRITLIPTAGSQPSKVEQPDLVFVDSSHERDETVLEFNAWSPMVAPGGKIVFHDWENQNYPGVTEAIRHLGLNGDVVLDMFVWRKPAD